MTEWWLMSVLTLAAVALAFRSDVLPCAALHSALQKLYRVSSVLSSVLIVKDF